MLCGLEKGNPNLRTKKKKKLMNNEDNDGQPSIGKVKRLKVAPVKGERQREGVCGGTRNLDQGGGGGG